MNTEAFFQEEGEEPISIIKRVENDPLRHDFPFCQILANLLEGNLGYRDDLSTVEEWKIFAGASGAGRTYMLRLWCNHPEYRWSNAIEIKVAQEAEQSSLDHGFETRAVTPMVDYAIPKEWLQFCKCRHQENVTINKVPRRVCAS